MASMSVSGVVSGMDWESMIDSVIESAMKPAQVQVNKRTNLQNKKSLFEEMKVTMNSIQSSLSPLKLPSTYKAKEIEIERIDTNSSYKGVLTATVNADAEVNVYDLEVKQLARSQTNRSAQITSSTLKSTLGSLESSKLYINAGNQKIGIDVYNTDSLDSLKSRINTTLKTLNIPVGITASVVDNKLILKSDSTGLGTTSVSGTASQKYNSSGYTDLGTIITDSDAGSYVNIVVDDTNAENLKVSSGSKSYSIHKDYEVVNNQIRWKQYEDTDNVKLGDSISAKYTMAKGDVYSTTVKRGSDDSDSVSFDFDLIDKGTLSQRIKVKGYTTTTTTDSEEVYSLSDDQEIGTTTTTETDDDGTVTTTTITISEDEDDDGNTVYTIKTQVDVTTSTDFVYGKDFTYSDGKITWLEQESETNEPESYTVSFAQDDSVNYSVDSSSDDSMTFNASEFNTAYKKATGSDISTITITGSDGVIRTYLDPSDSSLFNLVDDNGNEYTYGRDYVIRVSDDGSGYVLSWFASEDKNGDGTIDANDANIAVTAYAQEKNISTLNFKKAPDSGVAYNFNFSAEGTKNYSASVTASDEDKDLSLSSLFEDLTLTSSDYSDIVISSGSKTYTYGKDFTVNSDGEIEWLPKYEVVSHAPEEFTVSYTTDTAVNEVFSETLTSGSGTELEITDLFTGDTETGLEYLSSLYYNGTLATYSYSADPNISILDLYDSENPIVLNIDGTDYEYGKDFVVRTGEDEASNPQLFISFARTHLSGTETDYFQDYKNYLISQGHTEDEFSSTKNAPASGTSMELKIFQTEDVDIDESYDSTSDSDSVLTNIIEAADGDYENLIITDGDGKTYTYVASESDLDENSFTIVDGKIKWYETTEAATLNTPNVPDENTEYTVSYESFAGIEVTVESDAADSFELKLTNDNGKLSDSDSSYLSYEQILKDISSKLTTESDQDDVDEALADYFSIVDGEGKTYEYGTDFRITMGNQDSTSGQHKAILEWITEGPLNGDVLTISYTGRGEGGGEVLNIDEAVTRSNSDVIIDGSPVYSEFQSGTTTINQGGKTFYEGYDFEVGTNDDGNVLINWKTGTDYEWYFPQSGSYTINLTTADGTEKTFSAIRSYEDTLDLRNFGLSTVSGNGTLNSITYDGTTYNLTSTTTNDDGKTDSDLVKEKLGININEGTNGGVKVYNFDWTTPTLTTREGLPGYGDEISIEYEYNTNTFTLSDDGDGLVDLLGLNSDITEAQNAILVLDGEEVERDLNNIGESYGNELIKGMTINLKGVGEVSMDVSHDAEKAVESIQTFVDNYNSLMSWINTRMTESQVDKDTAATIDSDDFRMRWGLLHGNALLRNTKSTMRDTVAQNFTFSFTSRTSSEEIYGAMSYNGLKTDSTLRLRINSTYVDVPVLTTDTLQDIVDKISDSSNAAMRNIFYDSDGKLLDEPLIKAKIEGDKLVISSSSNDEITMSGTAAMNALKLNYTYKGIYQLGISTTSDDYGKSGELEFDTEKFMEALEDNPDEVQSLMLKFASTMDSWTKSMLNSSASGQTSGTLTRQIEDIDTQIASIDEYLEKYQDRLDRMEENLRSKYSAAEQQISKLTQQASAISAILQQLNGNSSSSSSSSS